MDAELVTGESSIKMGTGEDVTVAEDDSEMDELVHLTDDGDVLTNVLEVKPVTEENLPSENSEDTPIVMRLGTGVLVDDKVALV